MTRELAGEWAKLFQAYADGKNVVSDFERHKNPFIMPFEKLDVIVNVKGYCSILTDIPNAYKIEEVKE